MGFKTATQQRSSERTQKPTGRMSTSSLSSRSPGHRLQGKIGNAATARLFKSRYIQPKLTVSHPEDESEREADRVADEVMRMPKPQSGLAVQRFPLKIQRACTKCVDDELQRQPNPAVNPKREEEVDDVSRRQNVAPTVSDALEGRGSPLSQSIRSFFEPRFGIDFGHVRVHTDARAAAASDDLRARAFTAGSDIYFAPGQYRPNSNSGDRLLGHELTHVIQQGSGRQTTHIQRKPNGSDDPTPTQFDKGCGTPTLKCPPKSVLTNETSNTVLGTAVHNIVQQNYLTAHQASLGQENFILIDRGWGEIHTKDGGSTAISRLAILDPPVHAAFAKGAKRGERGTGTLAQRPDILDDRLDAVSEIKSCTPEGRQEGRNDLVDYFSRLAIARQKIPPSGNRRDRSWHPGSWKPEDFAYGQGGLPVQIVFSMPESGLILYSIWTCRPGRDKDREPPIVGDRPYDWKGEPKSAGDPRGKTNGQPGKGNGQPGKGNGQPDKGIRTPGRNPQPPQPTLMLPGGIDWKTVLGVLAVLGAILSKTPMGKLGAVLGALLGQFLKWLGFSLGIALAAGAAAASTGGAGGSKGGPPGKGPAGVKIQVPGDPITVPGGTVTVPGKDPKAPPAGTIPGTTSGKVPPTPKVPPIAAAPKPPPKIFKLGVIEGVNLQKLSTGKLVLIKIAPGSTNEKVVLLRVTKINRKGNETTAEFESLMLDCRLSGGKCKEGNTDGNIYTVTHPYGGDQENPLLAVAIKEWGNTEGSDKVLEEIGGLFR